MELILGLLAMPLLLAPPILGCWAEIVVLRRWRGGWRIAAALPIAVAIAWLAVLMRDLAADPTSHNLFPFEIAIGAIGSLTYLGVLAALRRLLTGPAG